MESIRRKLESLLPAADLEKVRKLAQKGIDKSADCSTLDSRIYESEKYLDKIARRARDKEAGDIARSSLSIGEKAEKEAKIAGYGAALKALSELDDTGNTDRVFISICSSIIGAENRDSEKIDASKPFFSYLAGNARDDKVKHLASAISNYREYGWASAVISGCRAALSAMTTPLSGSIEQILISTGNSAFDGIKNQQGSGADIASAFGIEIGRVTNEPSMKSLAHVIENLDYREDGSRAACVEAYRALEKESTYPAEAGLPFLRVVGKNSSDEDLKKLIDPYVSPSFNLRSEEAAAGMRKIFASIVELHSAMEDLNNAGDKESDIIVSDGFVSVGGVKLDRNGENVPDRKIVVALQSLFSENLKSPGAAGDQAAR